MEDRMKKYSSELMVVIYKQHPFGNEYSSIADGDHGKPIMWWDQFVQEKDHPVQLGICKWAKNEETVGFMLWMVAPTYNAGQVVTMSSRFFDRFWQVVGRGCPMVLN